MGLISLTGGIYYIICVYIYVCGTSSAIIWFRDMGENRLLRRSCTFYFLNSFTNILPIHSYLREVWRHKWVLDTVKYLSSWLTVDSTMLMWADKEFKLQLQQFYLQNLLMVLGVNNYFAIFFIAVLSKSWAAMLIFSNSMQLSIWL